MTVRLHWLLSARKENEVMRCRLCRAHQQQLQLQQRRQAAAAAWLVRATAAFQAQRRLLELVPSCCRAARSCLLPLRLLRRHLVARCWFLLTITAMHSQTITAS